MTSEERVIEKYKIETIRHAANAIFNKLNEAYYCHGTPQGAEALLDAQSLANVIVQADNAAERIGQRPTSLKLDEKTKDIFVDPRARWMIRHPGVMDLIHCESFEFAMEKWFEGFNIPFLMVDGKKEDFAISRARVRAYLDQKAQYAVSVMPTNNQKSQ